MRSGFPRALAVAVALWLGGCSASPAPRLYVLSPAAEVGADLAGLAGVALGVGPVTLAPHLDRPQIVSRRGSEIHLAEFDRWAEPLADGIARTLMENLGQILATDRLWLYPWPPSVPVDIRVAVEVLRCDDDGDGAVLAARWTLFRGGGVLANGRFERREPATSAASASAASAVSSAATVEALSRALAGLSREIAEALAAHAEPDG